LSNRKGITEAVCRRLIRSRSARHSRPHHSLCS